MDSPPSPLVDPPFKIVRLLRIPPSPLLKLSIRGDQSSMTLLLSKDPSYTPPVWVPSPRQEFPTEDLCPVFSLLAQPFKSSGRMNYLWTAAPLFLRRVVIEDFVDPLRIRLRMTSNGWFPLLCTVLFIYRKLSTSYGAFSFSCVSSTLC